MNMTVNCPEIRTNGSSPNLDTLERAKAHDQRVRDLDQFVRGVWAELGYLCLLVRNGEEWRVLGHHSFDAWLLAAAPCSRASAYGGMKAFEELADDFTPAEMVEVPHGNAHVLKLLPKSVRCDPAVRKAAREQRPKQFLAKMQKEHPELHLETKMPKKFVFTNSQWDAIENAIEQFRKDEGSPETSDADAIEGICASYMLVVD